MPSSLPPNAHLRHLKCEAKAFLKAQKRGDPEACARLRVLRRFSEMSVEDISAARVSLQDVQYALALEYGFESWNKLKKHIESIRADIAPMKGENMSEISRTDVPHPYDQYVAPKRSNDLDPFLTQLVLSAFPKGSTVTSFQKGTQYAEYPDGHDRARVRKPNGDEEWVIVASDNYIGGVETEAAVLPALGRLGLPVSQILAGPATHPDYPGAGPFAVLTVLKGRYVPFLDLASRSSSEELDLSCRLLLEGTERLHATTKAMLEDESAKGLPRRTLSSELEGIVQRGGPWLEERVFTEAIELLRPALKEIETPLVFSNGLNYTWNFLHENGKLAGFVCFARACFEDPHVAFTTYHIWGPIDPVGWGPLNRAGLVERWLYAHNLSREAFAPRVALRCLWRLQREHPVEGDARDGGKGREGILKVLSENLEYIT